MILAKGVLPKSPLNGRFGSKEKAVQKGPSRHARQIANYSVKSESCPLRRQIVRHGRRDRQIHHRGVLKLILGMAVSETANLA